MAKKCSICGKKLGFKDGKISISDGIACTSCWTSAGLDMGEKAMSSARNRTSSQLMDMIDIENLKRQLKKDFFDGENEKPKAAPAKERQVQEEPKPVDIIIDVDADRTVAFTCKGNPVINFDDLVNGREMIIGDGFIVNQTKKDLPEVRIACEFEPAIVDPGIIYYEAGTFKAGINGRFEIDDPPVNLEEYAKIKRTRKGKVIFTLFFGEQEICSSECSMKVKPAPAEEMKKLLNAIMYEEEKNASGPVNVFLYARENGVFEMDLMRHPELLYSMYSNGQEQLIGDVYVANDTGKPLKDVRFEAEFNSDILSSVNILLGDVPAGEKKVFEVDDPAIDLDKLVMLTDVEKCIATYSLQIDGKTVAESTGKITICPYNQWNAALILLPAYMTPNHPNVINILQNASKWMIVNGMNPSLEGYQSKGDRVEEMVGAVFNAVKESNIIYSNPPASFFGPQRIRLCESVFEHKFATCMDMTILFASCLESFGLHPILITAPGHIFAGVWLNAKGHFQEPVLSDAKLVQKYIEGGELVAVECTSMNMGKEDSYEDAKKIAYENIKAIAKHDIPDHECIDVQIARAMGIRPLPMRVNHTYAPADQYVKAEKKIPEPVEEKKQEESEAAAAEIKPEAEKPVSNATVSAYEKVDYKAFEEDLTNISIDNFYDKQTRRVLKDAIAEIVAVEGPISQPALIRTLINTTNLGRAGKQIAEHLDKMVAAADVKITRQAGVRFLWNHGTDPAEYMEYRYREQRNPEDICKYELKNAVCYLLQENGPMTKAEITKAMVSLFGYSRSSKKLEDGANAAIKAARELKAIVQDEDKRFVLTQ